MNENYKIEEFKWGNENTSWAWITNKYGRLLSYNLKRYHKGYMMCGYQGYITEMLESGNYELFMDCGAYIGLFSQIASFNCKKVISYEAHPFYHGILQFNMRFLRNVECYYKYISCRNDEPKMDLDVKGLVVNDSKESYKIQVTTIDWELKRYWYKRTLIKLDIEGNELKALDGATDSLKNDLVHWIIDVHTQHGITSEQVLAFFKDRKITMISPKVIKVEGLK